MAALRQRRHDDPRRRDFSSPVRIVVRLTQRVPFDDRPRDARERASRLLPSTA
ncbi:MAG TPA: hypothetical protein VGP82_01370 [Ktedonobacterales bacterium]|jgi:hypothetical protein|nr:hypothetical protein [Ktedonobacterales bacterium]